MTELTFFLLILNIIVLFVFIIILYFVLRRRGSSSPVGLKKKHLSDDKISKEACEDLGGTDRNGRCIILTVEGNRECIMDIGRIYEKDN